ncbi:hypothetical protein [Actinomadura craniellae]|nr:hypothetical protein [Actinomadura craniellae]
MPSTAVQEVGKTIRFAMKDWGMTARLCVIILLATVLFIAISRLPLIAW